MGLSLTAPLVVAAALGISLGMANLDGKHDPPEESCAPVSGWMAPDGSPFEAADLLGRVARGSVVLLGERHDTAAHHQWQLETLRALHERRPTLVLGLEMFPRRVQPALDAWVRGELSEAQFLAQSEWTTVWRFDPALYMGIFRYARDHRIPMRALNVEAALTRSVGREGFDAVPWERREGVTRPAEPSARYAAWLSEVFQQHAPHPALAPDRAKVRRFIEAQLVWDRAMAQGIRDALDAHPGALVVGLMGSGHLEHGFGVPHQLDDLGVRERATLLPWDRHSDCRQLVAGLADALYSLDGPVARKGVPS